MSSPLDPVRLSRELIRAIRGRRSQVAFSRRLGYASNVAYTWESGKRFPAASEALRAAEQCGIDVDAAFRRFYRTPPAWLDGVSMSTSVGVARFLQHERGKTPIVAIAARARANRFSVARWLDGAVEPRLPDFLRLVDAASLRLLDLVAELVDPSALPSAARAWLQLEAQRDLASALPYTQAVLRVLELDAYRAEPHHVPGFVARILGITLQEEEDCLNALARAGEIRLASGRWVTEEVTVDTRRTPESSRSLKTFWAEVALERLREGRPGRFSYNVISVSEADLARLEEMHLAFFRSIRTVVADSAPAERVALVNVQLVPLDGRAVSLPDPRPDP
jgi:hypothetical protein